MFNIEKRRIKLRCAVLVCSHNNWFGDRLIFLSILGLLKCVVKDKQNCCAEQ